MSAVSYRDIKAVQGLKVMKYGVFKENVVVQCLSRSEDRVVRAGTLVEIQSCLLEEFVAFIVFEPEREGDELNQSVWVGSAAKIIPVIPALWQAFQAINSPLQRIQIAKDQSLCNELAHVEVGEIVNLTPDIRSAQELREPEMSLVRYKGPVPELGVGHYFGLELLAGGSLGDCDGSICGKRYFSCAKKYGTFVSLNRLLPYCRAKHVVLDENSKPESTTNISSSSSSILMPSNDKRIQHHGENTDSSNRTTLVFRLKEKENMPRSQPPRVEKIDTLIDLEPSSNSSEVGNPSLKVGDRVVWFGDEKPEFATVQWVGRLDNCANITVGIECDNPVGSGTGCYNGQPYFTALKDHAKFIPLASLVKENDFLSKPVDLVKKKVRNWQYIENFSNSSMRHQCSGRLEVNTKDLGYLPAEAPLVDIDVPDNIPLLPKEKQGSGLCRSEYVFSEEPHSGRTENTSKYLGKDSKNNNVRKTNPSSNNHITDTSPRHCAVAENFSSKHSSEQGLKNNNDIKLRHSTVSDSCSGLTSGTDTLAEWQVTSDSAQGRERRTKALGPGGRPSKLNNISTAEPFLDAGDALLPSKVTEICDIFLSPSCGVTGDGIVSEHLPDSPSTKEPTDLGVGSVVEVSVSGTPRYGVIRWIGVPGEDKRKGRKVAGIEMEEEHPGLTDGTYNGRRYFQCNPKKAMFVNLSQCQRDSRFQDMQLYLNDTKAKNFGQVMCPVIPGVVKPLSWKDDSEAHCGKFRGIQGHHNSCYLDATLFSMFTFTSVFDSLLFRPPTENDIVQYDDVQRVLREEIVNPLRQNLYVRADRVMKLRTLLENLSSVTGLTSEEKDPEEFLTSLVAQILRAEPFLKLSSGQEAYHYQLFVEKDEHLVMPSVQQLFDQSFLTSDIKLKEVPPCLIIQMPRFGKSFKMYPRILPSQLLDITDIIEDSPRQCTVCGKLAEFECRECFGQCGTGLESIAFCMKCLDTDFLDESCTSADFLVVCESTPHWRISLVICFPNGKRGESHGISILNDTEKIHVRYYAHSHQRRGGHAWRPLSVPVEYSILKEHCHIPRLYMELFAVVCIETSHYVAFVKCGSGSDAPWCFFDSMADRKGEQNGYNIPEMVLCPKLPYWLSDEGSQSLQDIRDDRLLPEHAKRLLCDAYMCMYQSPDVMMYR